MAASSRVCPAAASMSDHDAGVVESGQLDAHDAVLSMQGRECFEQRVGA